MQSESSILLGDGTRSLFRRADGSPNPRGSWKATALAALLVAAALLVTLIHKSSTTATTTTTTKVSESHTAGARQNWDQVIHSWEAALFQNAAVKLPLEGRSRHHHDEKEDEPLVYLNTTEAFDMLKIHGHHHSSSTALDFYYYQQGWDAQINQAYCPVASSAAVLNSLRGKIQLPQDPVYVPFPWATQTQLIQNSCVRTNIYDVDEMQHVFFGMGLEMTQDLLNCQLADQGYAATAFRVDPKTTSAKQVRAALVDALQDENARAMINYDRGGIGQGVYGHGHFSPIGAYNADIDAFLVMDVAKYKYPPVWVPVSKLMGGIGSVDQCSVFRYPDAPPDLTKPFEAIARDIGCQAAYRGYIIVKKVE
jgi:hypothetical protein